MSLVRIAAIALGTFCMIGSTLAKPEPGADAEVKPAPAPDPAAARAGGGGVVHRGAGGVGFSAPRREEQLAALKLALEIGDDDWAKICGIL